jgi:hypothetical protein
LFGLSAPGRPLPPQRPPGGFFSFNRRRPRRCAAHNSGGHHSPVSPPRQLLANPRSLPISPDSRRASPSRPWGLGGTERGSRSRARRRDTLSDVLALAVGCRFDCDGVWVRKHRNRFRAGEPSGSPSRI